MAEIPSFDKVVNECYKPEDGRIDHGRLVEQLKEREGFVFAEIRQLHRKHDTAGYCIGCWEATGMHGAPLWPCPTIQVLDKVGE
jgi:hypothetical protein